MRIQTLAGVIGVALLAAGCRMDVDTTVSFRGNDVADVTVSAGFDAALASRLDALGVDPFSAFSQAEVFGWQLDRRIDESGLLRLGLRQQGIAANDVPGVLQSLSTGVRDTDVGLVFDLTTTTKEQLRTLAGTALFTPPTNQGVLLDGVALGRTAEQLAAQIQADVTVWFTVEVEGEIVSHNADELRANQVRWMLPVNEPVTIRVTVEPSTDTAGALTAALLAVTLLLGAGWLVWRRRRVAPDDTNALP